MPISASAKKSLRVALRQKAENQVTKSRLKRSIKAASSDNLSTAFSLIDKAAKNHVIHRNKAARLKSRLSKMAPVEAPAAKPAKSASKAKTAKPKSKKA